MKQSKMILILLMLRFESICSQRCQVGDSCVQFNKPGVATIDKDCKSFLEYAGDKMKYGFCGFNNMDALVCCAGFQTTTRKPQTSLDKLTTTRKTRRPTRKNHYATAQPIITRFGVESLCESMGPYPGELISERIFDGTASQVGEFPHFASLAYRDAATDKISFGCGGALISDRHVLTAAHCIYKNGPEFVRLGSISTFVDDHDGHVDVDVESITKHRNYRSDQMYHDIAIIKLEASVTFSRFIWPACLTKNDEIHSGRSLTIAGFGRVSEINKTATSNRLLKAYVEEVSLEDCRRIYEESFENAKIKGMPEGIINELICAKNSSSSADTCQGDSGSGLKLQDNKNFYIVGVTSFGIGCGTRLPSLYTRIASYIDWIEEVLLKQ